MSTKLLLLAALSAAALTFAPTAWANGNDAYPDDYDDDAYYDDHDDAYGDSYDDPYTEGAVVAPYPRDVIVGDVPDEVIIRTEILRNHRHAPACGCAHAYDRPYYGSRCYGHPHYGYRYGPARRALPRYYWRPW
jgi:hypothetical protein